MPKVYDNIDFFWSFDGDLSLDDNSDIRDTSYDRLRSIRQVIETIVKSDKGDWRLQQNLGGNLSTFVGEKNSRALGDRIRKQLISAFMIDGIFDISDLTIKIVPLSISTILIRVELYFLSNERVKESNKLNLTFAYDYVDNNVYNYSERYGV